MTSVKKVLVALILVGLLSGFYLTYGDFTVQNNYRSVMLILDYQSVVDWAEKTELDTEKLLRVAWDNGVKAVAVAEMPLQFNSQGRITGFFEDDPEVNAFSGLEVLSLYNLAPLASVWEPAVEQGVIEDNNIYIHTLNLEKGQALLEAALLKYGAERVQQVEVSDGVAFSLDHRAVFPVNGLGFNAATIDKLRSMGFAVIPRFLNAAYSEADRSRLSEYITSILERTDAPMVIFAGQEGVLGRKYGTILAADNLPVTADLLKANGVKYGHVEMTTIPGDARLAGLMDFHLVRVHSIGSREWSSRYDGKISTDTSIVRSVVQRYLLAVNDRSVRALYLRPFTASIDYNEHYFASLNSALSGAGYQVGAEADVVPGRSQLPQWALIVLLVGFNAAVVLLFSLFIHLDDIWYYLLLAAGSLLLIVVWLILPQYQLSVLKLLAFGSAVIFPVLGICAALMCQQAAKDAPVIYVTRALAAATGTSLVGAVYVHSALSLRRFMTAVDVFPMVKIALLLPALLVLVLYFWRHQQGTGALKQIALMPIRMCHLVLLGLLAIGALYMIVRSGNASLAFVPEIELKIRLFLQELLVARPRFKEFVIGYPSLLLAAYMQARKNRRADWVLLPLAAIGQASLLNTFAHLHKPLWMALLTTLNGLWAGVLVGIALILAYSVGEKLWLRVWERD